MAKQASQAISGEIVEHITLSQLCRSCGVHADWIIELVEEGILEPEGVGVSKWKFSQVTIGRVRKAWRLQSELGVNLAGVGLALELLEERERLQSRLQRVESFLEDTIQDVDD